ncbi:MAG: hypothetical protein ABSA46_01265 [Thermodesulfovibrionales bacterium]
MAERNCHVLKDPGFRMRFLHAHSKREEGYGGRNQRITRVVTEESASICLCPPVGGC